MIKKNNQSRRSRIKEINGKILGYEIELDTLSDEFDKLSKELSYLLQIKMELEINLRILKEETQIVSLAEYRKNLENYRLSVDKIEKMSKDTSNLSVKMQHKQKQIDFYTEEWEKEVIESEKELVILIFKTKESSGN